MFCRVLGLLVEGMHVYVGRSSLVDRWNVTGGTLTKMAGDKIGEYIILWQLFCDL